MLLRLGSAANEEHCSCVSSTRCDNVQNVNEKSRNTAQSTPIICGAYKVFKLSSRLLL